jgi:hypothetical protein
MFRQVALFYRARSFTTLNIQAAKTQATYWEPTFRNTKPMPFTAPAIQWPYSLPKAMQPKAGTTFAIMHGSALKTQTQQHIGVLQAMLYGVTDPDKNPFMKSMMHEGGIMHKVLYGVKEVGDEHISAAGKKASYKTL